MKNVPVIESFKNQIRNKNKNIPNDILENKINLLLNIKFYEMEYVENIMLKVSNFKSKD